VTAQILAQITRCYRIGDPAGALPIFDATGSKIAPGRWNTPSSPMIQPDPRHHPVWWDTRLFGRVP